MKIKMWTIGQFWLFMAIVGTIIFCLLAANLVRVILAATVAAARGAVKAARGAVKQAPEQNGKTSTGTEGEAVEHEHV